MVKYFASILALLSLGFHTVQLEAAEAQGSALTPAECYSATLKEIEERMIFDLPDDWDKLKSLSPNTAAELDLYVQYAIQHIGAQKLAVVSTTRANDKYARTRGGESGIGITVGLEPVVISYAKIKRFSPDSTADQAGLATGDLIVSIDGEPVAGWTYESVAQRLKGEPATVVGLTVHRGLDLLTISAERDVHGDIPLTLDRSSTRTALAVAAIQPGSQAARSSVLVGDIILEIDDTNAAELAISTQLLHYFSTVRQGGTVKLVLSRQNKRVRVALEQGVVPDGERMLPTASSSGSTNGHDWVLLRIQNLDWTNLINRIDLELQSKKDASGLILDLRRATGGDPNIAAQLIERFIASPSPRVAANLKSPGMEKPYPFVYGSSPAPTRFEDKVIVLVDEQTSGTAELVASVLQKENRAFVRGRPTAGDALLTTVKSFDLLDGSRFSIEIPTSILLASTNPDPKPLTAVYPDIVDNGLRVENPFDDPVIGRAQSDLFRDKPGGYSAGTVLFVFLASIVVVFIVLAGVIMGEALKHLTKKTSPWFTLTIITVATGVVLLLVFFSSPSPPASGKVIVEAFVNGDAESVAQAKVLAQLETEYTGPITFNVIDATDTSQTPPEVQNFPTVRISVVYYNKDGEQISSSWNQSGSRSKTELTEAISLAVENAKRNGKPDLTVIRK